MKLSWNANEIANTNFRGDEEKNYDFANCQSQKKKRVTPVKTSMLQIAMY